MSRNDSARNISIPTNEFVLGAQDLQRWDVSQAAGLNGDDGGTWAPTTPIIIGGSGMTLGASTVFVGGALTTTGGRVVLGASDFPTIFPPITRTITLRMWDAWLPQATHVAETDEQWIALSQPPSQLGSRMSASVVASMVLAFPRQYLHNVATFQSATLTFRITARPTALPSYRMWFQPVCRSFNGNTLALAGLPAALPYSSGSTWAPATAYPLSTLLYSTTNNGYTYKVTAVSGTGTSGATEPVWPTVIGNTVIDNPGANQITWTCIDYSGVVLPAAFPDAYYNAGQPQTVTVSASAATSVIDGSSAVYYIQLGNVDPTATLHAVQLNFSHIQTMQFP